MDAERVRPALVVLLGVLAVSAAAATFDGQSATAVGSGGDGAGEGAGDGTGSGDGAAGGFDPVGTELHVGLPTWVLRHFFLLAVVGGLLVTLGYAAVMAWLGRLDELKDLLATVASPFLGTAIYLLLVVVAALAWASGGGIPTPGDVPEQPGGGGGGASSGPGVDPTGTGIPPAILVPAVAVLGLIAIAMVARARDDESDASVPDDEDDGDPDQSAPGFTRPPEFDDVSPSNPVYRAWRRLATSVEERPDRTATPGELARRAVEEGLDRDAVDTLRETFEEVRYGGRPPTGERAERARRALERIDDREGGA